MHRASQMGMGINSGSSGHGGAGGSAGVGARRRPKQKSRGVKTREYLSAAMNIIDILAIVS